MARPIDFAVHSFAGGVMSAILDARTDLEKYYIAARTLNNVFVLRSGSAANRSGFEHLGDVKDATKLTIAREWLFDEDDRYVIEAGNAYFRFWQDGGRIATLGTAAWVAGKYYVVGDLVVVANVEYYCKQPHVAHTPPNAAYWYALTVISTSPQSSIYEIPSPYAATATANPMREGKWQQSADVTWIAHSTYAPHELKRYGATNWTLLPANFAPPIDGPGGCDSTGGSGTALTDKYKITSVKKDTEEESLPGHIGVVVLSTADLTNAGGGGNLQVTSAGNGSMFAVNDDVLVTDAFALSGIPDATFEASLEGQVFNISAKTTNTFDLQGTAGAVAPAGYRLTCIALILPNVKFMTINIPAGSDITLQMAGGVNPHNFADGDEVQILKVQYSSGSIQQSFIEALEGKQFTVTVVNTTDIKLDGTAGIPYGGGYDIYLAATTIVEQHNASVDVSVFWKPVVGASHYYVYKKSNGVYGYLATVSEAPTALGNIVYIDKNTATAGAGADTSDTPPTFFNPFSKTGDYPAVVCMHDQRLCFGATDNHPSDFWLSRPGDFLNFTHSSPIKDDDALHGTIIGAQEIRSMLDLDQLIVVSSSGLYFMEGDADGTLTPAIKARRRGGIGATTVAPLIIDDSVLFVSARSGTVRDFRLDAIEFQKGRDLTTFAPTLVDGFTLTQWTFQRNPHSLLWAVRDDGRLLGLTYVREQEIAAWHTHDTGQNDTTGSDAGFESVAVIPDGAEDAVYAVVNRTHNPVYDHGARYEPPTGMCVFGGGFYQQNNRAFRALCNDTGLEMIPSTANVAGGNPANVLITSQGSSVSSTAHTGHGLIDGDVVICTNVWVANADGFSGVTVGGALTGGVQANGLFAELMLGQTFTVTAATTITFELAATTTITVPANHRCVFIRKGILVNTPAYSGPVTNAGGNSSGHGKPAYGVYGTPQLNKALSGGAAGGVNIRITTATPPAVGQWIRITDVDPSAGPPDLVFEALLEGNDYLVSAIQAATWFEIAGTSGITVPATQQTDYVVRGTLPNWPGTLSTAVFDAPLSGGLGTGTEIIVTSATTPTFGQRILVIDVTRTAGAVQATFEATLEAHSYVAIGVVAGVSFKLQGTSAITVPPNQIMDFTLVTGDINFYSTLMTEDDVVTSLQDADSMGAIACLAVFCQDQVGAGGAGVGQIGLDDVLDTHLPADQYNGIINQLAELGFGIGLYGKPVMLHIMGECNIGHGYHRANFPQGFAEARTRIRAACNLVGSFLKVAVAWNVIADANDPDGDQWSQWYPGDGNCDWGGIDVFNAANTFFPGSPAASNIEAYFEFLKGKNKPAYIPESGPVGSQMPDILPDFDNGGTSDDEARDSAAHAWTVWFGPYFQWIKDHPIVKGVRIYEQDFVGTAYDGPPLFWKNTRLAKNKFILAKIFAEIRDGRWITSDQRSLLKDWRTNMGLSAEPAAATTRTMERMRPRKAGESGEYDERIDSFFVDAGATWDGRNIVGSDMEGHATTTLALSAGTTYDAHTYATLTAVITAPVVVGPFAAGDVNTVGYRLVDPVTGDETECLVTAFTSDLVVTVEFQQDCEPRLANGTPATLWTKMVGSISGLSRLEGRILNVLGDGIRQPTVAVANAIATFQKPLGIIQYGLPAVAEIETLDLDVPDGKIAGKMVRPVEVTAIVHNTRGALFGPSDGGVLVPMRETPVLESDAEALFSGKATCKMRGSSKLKSSIIIRQTDPLPMLVEGLYPRAEV